MAICKSCGVSYYREPISQECLENFMEIPGHIPESIRQLREDPTYVVEWARFLTLLVAVPVGMAVNLAFALIFSPFWAMRVFTPRLYNALADFFAEPV